MLTQTFEFSVEEQPCLGDDISFFHSQLALGHSGLASSLSPDNARYTQLILLNFGGYTHAFWPARTATATSSVPSILGDGRVWREGCSWRPQYEQSPRPPYERGDTGSGRGMHSERTSVVSCFEDSAITSGAGRQAGCRQASVALSSGSGPRRSVGTQAVRRDEEEARLQ
jgi:hypothetical protein